MQYNDINFSEGKSKKTYLNTSSNFISIKSRIHNNGKIAKEMAKFKFLSRPPSYEKRNYFNEQRVNIGNHSKPYSSVRKIKSSNMHKQNRFPLSPKHLVKVVEAIPEYQSTLARKEHLIKEFIPPRASDSIQRIKFSEKANYLKKDISFQGTDNHLTLENKSLRTSNYLHRNDIPPKPDGYLIREIESPPTNGHLYRNFKSSEKDGHMFREGKSSQTHLIREIKLSRAEKHFLRKNISPRKDGHIIREVKSPKRLIPEMKNANIFFKEVNNIPYKHKEIYDKDAHFERKVKIPFSPPIDKKSEKKETYLIKQFKPLSKSITISGEIKRDITMNHKSFDSSKCILKTNASINKSNFSESFVNISIKNNVSKSQDKVCPQSFEIFKDKVIKSKAPGTSNVNMLSQNRITIKEGRNLMPRSNQKDKFIRINPKLPSDMHLVKESNQSKSKKMYCFKQGEKYASQHLSRKAKDIHNSSVIQTDSNERYMKIQNRENQLMKTNLIYNKTVKDNEDKSIKIRRENSVAEELPQADYNRRHLKMQNREKQFIKVSMHVNYNKNVGDNDKKREKIDSKSLFLEKTARHATNPSRILKKERTKGAIKLEEKKTGTKRLNNDCNSNLSKKKKLNIAPEEKENPIPKVSKCILQSSIKKSPVTSMKTSSNGLKNHSSKPSNDSLKLKPCPKRKKKWLVSDSSEETSLDDKASNFNSTSVSSKSSICSGEPHEKMLDELTNVHVSLLRNAALENIVSKKLMEKEEISPFKINDIEQVLETEGTAPDVKTKCEPDHTWSEGAFDFDFEEDSLIDIKMEPVNFDDSDKKFEDDKKDLLGKVFKDDTDAEAFHGFGECLKENKASLEALPENSDDKSCNLTDHEAVRRSKRVEKVASLKTFNDVEEKELQAKRSKPIKTKKYKILIKKDDFPKKNDSAKKKKSAKKIVSAKKKFSAKKRGSATKKNSTKKKVSVKKKNSTKYKKKISEKKKSEKEKKCRTTRRPKTFSSKRSSSLLKKRHSMYTFTGKVPVKSLKVSKKKTIKIDLNCHFCNMSFMNMKAFKAHSIIHATESGYVCKVCAYVTPSIQYFLSHVRIHTGEKPFHCNVCPYRASLNSLLIIHMRTHSGEKPYKCNFCTYKSSSSATMIRHCSTHTVDKPFSCNYCKKPFASYGNLKRHYLTLHKYLFQEKSEPYYCYICLEGFKWKHQWLKHKSIHSYSNTKQLKCFLCPYWGKYYGPMRKHLSRHQMVGKNYKCSTCSLQTDSAVTMFDHLEQHKKENPKIKPQGTVICVPSCEKKSMKHPKMFVEKDKIEKEVRKIKQHSIPVRLQNNNDRSEEELLKLTNESNNGKTDSLVFDISNIENVEIWEKNENDKCIKFDSNDIDIKNDSQQTHTTRSENICQPPLIGSEYESSISLVTISKNVNEFMQLNKGKQPFTPEMSNFPLISFGNRQSGRDECKPDSQTSCNTSQTTCIIADSKKYIAPRQSVQKIEQMQPNNRALCPTELEKEKIKLKKVYILPQGRVRPTEVENQEQRNALIVSEETAIQEYEKSPKVSTLTLEHSIPINCHPLPTVKRVYSSQSGFEARKFHEKENGVIEDELNKNSNLRYPTQGVVNSDLEHIVESKVPQTEDNLKSILFMDNKSKSLEPEDRSLVVSSDAQHLEPINQSSSLSSSQSSERQLSNVNCLKGSENSSESDNCSIETIMEFMKELPSLVDEEIISDLSYDININQERPKKARDELFALAKQDESQHVQNHPATQRGKSPNWTSKKAVESELQADLNVANTVSSETSEGFTLFEEPANPQEFSEKPQKEEMFVDQNKPCKLKIRYEMVSGEVVSGKVIHDEGSLPCEEASNISPSEGKDQICSYLSPKEKSNLPLTESSSESDQLSITEAKNEYSTNVIESFDNQTIKFDGSTRTEGPALSHSKENKSKNFKCTFCEFKTDKLYKFNVHLEEHSDMKPFECSFCPQTFSHSYQLRIHFKEHNEDS